MNDGTVAGAGRSGVRKLDPGYSVVQVASGTLALSGEFDTANSHVLHAAVEDVIAAGKGCVLDCHDVVYMDSTALHVLARAARLVEADVKVVIARPPPFLVRLLQITGLAKAPNIDVWTELDSSEDSGGSSLPLLGQGVVESRTAPATRSSARSLGG